MQLSKICRLRPPFNPSSDYSVSGSGRLERVLVAGFECWNLGILRVFPRLCRVSLGMGPLSPRPTGLASALPLTSYEVPGSPKSSSSIPTVMLQPYFVLGPLRTEAQVMIHPPHLSECNSTNTYNLFFWIVPHAVAASTVLCMASSGFKIRLLLPISNLSPCSKTRDIITL